MDGSSSYQSLQQQISAQLVATTRTAGQLAAEDLDFLRASDRKAGKRLDRRNGQLLDIAQQLMASATNGTQLAAPSVKKSSKIDENWRSIADIIDNLLERADRCLDEYTGVITKLSKEKENAASDRETTRKRRDGKTPRVHPLEKPQLRFRHVPRNDETTPFKPLLTSKPHALVPLEQCLQKAVDGDGAEYFPHPYDREIQESKYPPPVYVISEPIPSIDDPNGKSLTWVDTPEKVTEMLAELRKAKEIAVDLEHHDAHSYVGLVCLMQISTRDHDWIVDTLKPWREDLQVLNEVFTDPSILKVFHGAAMDMIWLQRDLGLYVVGLFDTYHATNALQYPRHGLAYLLKRFEDFDAQKQYQMADWRVRPLSKEMMQYARSDTHFLLHVYDCIRNELVENSNPQQDLVGYVLEKSKMEALQRYERFIYNEDRGFGAQGWLGLLIRTPAMLNKEQFAVFRAVHHLRDQIARKADESLISVMRNDTIFAVARIMPEEMPELMNIIQPVSQFMQPRVSELLNVIKSAKAKGESGPTIDEVLADPTVVAYQEQMGLGRFRKRLDKKAVETSSKTTTPALAETIRSERERLNSSSDVAHESSFWGSTLDTGAIDRLAVDIRLEVPLPDVGMSELSLGPAQEQPRKAATNTQAIDIGGLKPEADPQIFSIKELKQQSRKRKSDRALADTDAATTSNSNAAGGKLSNEPTANADETGSTKRRRKGEDEVTESDGKLDGGEAMDEDYTLPAGAVVDTAADSRKSKKEKKREERRAREQAAREAQENEVPFDYASAPSVLAGATDHQGGGQGKKKQQQQKQKDKKAAAVYDPYAKALDTPKGLPRRANGAAAGRSKTFKS